jgi:hypothetical protein
LRLRALRRGLELNTTPAAHGLLKLHACADRCQPLTQRRLFAADGTPLTLAATPELSAAMAALQDAGERHATCTVRIK